MALAFECGAVKIPNEAVLIFEMQAFEARPLPSGMMRYAAPEDMHDDTVMALAIGYAGLGALQQQSQPKTIWLDPESGYWVDYAPEPYRISPV